MISIKSNHELDLMKKAGEVLANTHRIVEKAVKPGCTTKELDIIAEEYIRSMGAEPSFKGYQGLPGAVDYPASICASVNNEVVHGLPGLKVLKDGDIISVDIGVFLNGYHSDSAKTYAVGNISENAARLIEVTRQSFYEGIKFAVYGNRIGDISAAIQDYVELNGFSAVRDYVGHGIGTQMHEWPQIPNYRTGRPGPRLQPGMTLAIEPMINEGGYDVRLLGNRWTVVTADGSLSAHYEHTIAITKSEPILLSKLS